MLRLEERLAKILNDSRLVWTCLQCLHNVRSDAISVFSHARISSCHFDFTGSGTSSQIRFASLYTLIIRLAERRFLLDLNGTEVVGLILSFMRETRDKFRA